MNKFCSLLFAALFFISCNSGSVETRKSQAAEQGNRSENLQNAPLDSVVQSLLSASASDFHEHQPPVAVSFRNLRIGYVTHKEQKLFRMCGEFLALDNQDKDQWTPFATIITSDYEQWIGEQALPFCSDSTIVWYDTKDLSGELKSKLAGLK